MRKSALAVLGLSLAFWIGCGRSGNQQPQGAVTPPPAAADQQAAQTQPPAQVAEQPAGTTQPAAAPQQAAAPAGTPAAAPTRTPAPQPAGVPTAAPVSPAQPAIQPVTPPAPRTAAIQPGTTIAVRLTQALDSGKNKTGEKFEAALDQALVVGDQTVAPRGSVVTGKLASVEGSGRVEGVAKMSLVLTEIKIGEQVYPISTDTLSFEAEGSKKKDATKIGIGAGVGAVIGAIAGGGKGAAIGAAVGGGAGTATVLATKGKEVKFDSEQKLNFSLKQELTVTLK
jgi:hypothetical protein